jgi:hypothetical protein
MKNLLLVFIAVFAFSASAQAEEITIPCGPLSGKIFVNNKWEDDSTSTETYFVIDLPVRVDIRNDVGGSYERDGFVITMIRVPTGIVFLAIYSSENTFFMDAYAINEQTSTLTLTRKTSVNVNGTPTEWSSVYTGHCDISVQ